MTAKEMFQKGEELLNSQKKEEATSYIIKSADMGYPLAQAVLGGFYMEGQGVPLGKR